MYTSTSLVWFLFLKHPKHLNEIHFFINKFINGRMYIYININWMWKQYGKRC